MIHELGFPHSHMKCVRKNNITAPQKFKISDYLNKRVLADETIINGILTVEVDNTFLYISCTKQDVEAHTIACFICLIIIVLGRLIVRLTLFLVGIVCLTNIVLHRFCS